jgi:hypothetical protein
MNSHLIYIVIQNRGGVSTAWENIAASVPKRIVAIVDKAASESMKSQPFARQFLSIIVPSSFSVNALAPFIASYIEKWGRENLRIMTNHEDDVETCARLREQYRISGPYHQDVLRFRNKLKMKEQLRQHPEWLPKHKVFDRALFLADPGSYVEHLETALGFPLFEKPIDGAGSVKSGVLLNKNELIGWAETAPDDIIFELDEFIDGELYHCDSFVSSGIVHHTQVCRYLRPNADFFSGFPLASITVPRVERPHEKLRSFSDSVLEFFKPLPDGIIHMEVFVDKVGRMTFLELACRPPGAHIPELYRHQLGVEVRSEHLISQISGAPTRLTESPYYYASLWFPNRRGNALNLNSPIGIGSEYRLQPRFRPGPMNSATSFADRCVEMIMWSADWEQLNSDFKKLETYEPVIFE